MTTVNLIVWIVVYSICLVHITAFTGIYIKNKSKIELLYLIVLLNLFLLAVIITISLVFRYNNFIPVLVNGILSLYITVPLWGYCLFDVEKKYFKIIPVLVITETIIENILLAHNVLDILFISRIVFYCFLTAPVFLNRKNKYEKNSLERKMQNVTKITVILFAVFMASLIPFSVLVFEISYVSSLFWAVFTLSYQIPGLVYCVNRTAKKDVTFTTGSETCEQQVHRLPGEFFGKTEIPSLTKRENEVALTICSGLTYAQIAEKLFISLSAVKKHAYSIYKKLGIKNNRELLHVFMEYHKNNAVENNFSAD
ncbi:MAG: helix-turn-helix transcriptional regulator [Treponema sp.]|nr:helix-turn-helix transcriptional regulator [Treponema sp.]